MWGSGRTWRRRLRTVGVVAVVLAVAGCWEQVGYGPGHTWSNPVEDRLTTANVVSLHEDWSTSLGGYVSQEPIVSGGRVFVTTTTGAGSMSTASLDVHAVDATTGAPIWSTNAYTDGSYNVELHSFDASVASGQLWTGANVSSQVGHFPPVCDSLTTRLDPATGTVVAQDESFGSTVVQAGSHLLQVTGHVLEPGGCDTSGTASLVARDRETLATEWSAPLGWGSLMLGNLGPTVARDKVVLFDRGGVMAFALEGCDAPTCAPLWTLPLPFGAIPLGQPVAGPSGQVFVAVAHILDPPQRTELLSLDGATGAVNWTANLGTSSADPLGVAIAGGRVYVEGGRVFDAAGCGASTCTPAWTVTVSPGTGAAGPVVAGGVVYEGGPGVIHAYAAAGCGSVTCSPLVTLPVDGTPLGLSVADGRLYAANGTEVTAYTP